MKKYIVVLAVTLLLAGTNSCITYANEQIEQTVEAEISEIKIDESLSDIDLSVITLETDPNIIDAADLHGGVQVTPIEPEGVAQEGVLRRWLEGDYATGDWWGLRTKLEEHGVTVEATYLSDSAMKLYGGIDKHKHPFKYFGVIDAALILDTEKMGLWKNGQAVVRYQQKIGTGLNDEYIGAFQYLDAYDDPRDFAQVSEYWFEQGFFDNKIQYKIGKQDGCYDFMVLDMATNFVNNSHAYFMPNIPLPAYPDPALGMVLKINPTDWLSLRSGWYDGNAVGSTTGFNTAFGDDKASFLIQEIGIRHNKWDLPGTLLFGGWLHTGHVAELSTRDVERAQTFGWYVESEQMVWKENKEDAEDTQGLYVLGQLSMAPKNRAEASTYYGAALMYKGLIPNRDEDVAGIGTAIAKFSGNLKNIPDDGRYGVENVIEGFYKIQLTKWLSLMPFAQFVYRPNGQTQNAFAFGFRSTINF